MKHLIYSIVLLLTLLPSPAASPKASPSPSEGRGALTSSSFASPLPSEGLGEALGGALGEPADSFVALPISDQVFARMKGKSYPATCTVPRSQLRYIRVLHYDADGIVRVGEMVANQAIAADLIYIFRKLYQARYPIERMQLIDDFDADDEQSMRHNNSSCFCFRAVAGTKKLSHHARGMAVDINTLYNPYVKRRADGTLFVQPATARPYTDRSKVYPYTIRRGDLLHRLFTERGFKWGGDWKSCKDYQHFEK